MIDQVRAALETYRTRPVFQLLAVMTAPLLFFGYVLSRVPPGHPAIAYMALIAPAVGVFFAFLGEHLKVQFTSWRRKLSPNYVPPHLIAAFAVSSIIAVLLIVISLAFYRVAPPHVSTEAVAALWALSLAAFSIGYFYRPEVIYLLLMVTMLNGTFIQWVAGMNRFAEAIVLAADLLLTASLVKRMLSVNEEGVEYRWRDGSPGELQRNMWMAFSNRSRINSLFFHREHVLDRPHLLAGGVMAHVRHFVASMRTSQQSLPLTTAMFVAAFWASSLMTRSASFGVDALLLFFPGMMVFLQMEQPGRNLQSIFMLPLRREQIVSRYGFAVLLVLVEQWLSLAVALLIVNWMPIPGKIGAFPSITPFLVSLAAQLPIFGALTLIIGRPRTYMIALVLVSMSVVPFSAAGSLWLLSPVLIAGPVLIWFSYRHWCRAELL